MNYFQCAYFWKDFFQGPYFKRWALCFVIICSRHLKENFVGNFIDKYQNCLIEQSCWRTSKLQFLMGKMPCWDAKIRLGVDFDYWNPWLQIKLCFWTKKHHHHLGTFLVVLNFSIICLWRSRIWFSINFWTCFKYSSPLIINYHLLSPWYLHQISFCA